MKKSFAQRHHTGLAALGSFILLGTFIAKDVARENLKDYVSELSSVRDRYQQRATARDIEAMLTEIGDSVFRIDGKLDSQAIDARYKRTAAQNHNVIDDLTMIEKDLLESAIELDQTVPDHEKLQSEMRKGMAAIEDFDEKQQNLESRIEKTKDIPNLEEQLLTRAKLLEEEQGQMKLQSAIGATANNFAQHVIGLAEDERERKEKQYQLSQYASWGFYFVGWVLSAAGLSGGKETS